MAVVVAPPTDDSVRVVPLTTLRAHSTTNTTAIERWQEIGASRPLGARFRVVTIDPRLCSKIEGVLATDDWCRVADIAARLGTGPFSTDNLA